MVAETDVVWAIDIGNNSLKALSLSTERGVVEVIGFDNIRHGKILSGDGVTDAEREELVALSLRKFVNKYDLSMDEIIISVPSQNSFARFVNLPGFVLIDFATESIYEKSIHNLKITVTN